MIENETDFIRKFTENEYKLCLSFMSDDRYLVELTSIDISKMKKDV